MKVHQPQHGLLTDRGQSVQQLDQLDGTETKLGLLAGALGPAAGSLARELDADTDGGLHAHFLGHTKQHLELVQLLQHDHHGVA